MERDRLVECGMAISAAVGQLKALQGSGSPVAGRPLAVAITELETGLLWLNEAIEEAEARRQSLTVVEHPLVLPN